MKWLLITDLHLEKYRKFGYDEKYKIEENVKDFITFMSVINNAIKKNEVEKVIFIGDLFERRSDIKTDLFNIAYKLFKNLSKEAEVIMIVGNHDKKGNFFTFQSFDFAKRIDKPTIIGEGFKVALVPYITSSEPMKDLEADICIGHFSVKGMPKSMIGDSSITFDDVSKFERVILGHEHKYSTSKNVVYIGASLPTKFRDNDVAPSYWLLQGTNLERKILPLPRFIIIDNTEDIVEDKVKNNYVRVVISNLKENIENIKKKTLDLGAKYVEVVYKKEVMDIKKEDISLLSFDLESACEEYVKLHIKDETEQKKLIKIGREVLINAVKKDKL